MLLCHPSSSDLISQLGPVVVFQLIVNPNSLYKMPFFVLRDFKYFFHYSNETNQLWIPTKTEVRLLPDVIIIGVNKCGTKALLMFLRTHPDIVGANRELHFFDKFKSYTRGLSEYVGMFPTRKRADQILLEKTPAYFHTPEVAKRIHAAIPDVKMLLTVRDPVTRMISSYAKYRERLLRANETTELYPPSDFEVRTVISL